MLKTHLQRKNITFATFYDGHNWSGRHTDPSCVAVMAFGSMHFLMSA